MKELKKGESWRRGYMQGIKELKERVEVMISEEMVIAQKEGQPTSRLTSLAVRIGELK